MSMCTYRKNPIIIALVESDYCAIFVDVQPSHGPFKSSLTVAVLVLN